MADLSTPGPFRRPGPLRPPEPPMCGITGHPSVAALAGKLSGIEGVVSVNAGDVNVLPD